MFSSTKYVDPVARALMAAIFLLSALGKLGAPGATQGYMVAMGVPGALLWPTILFELGAGGLLLAGPFTRPVALLLAGFSLATGFIFHNRVADQTQMIMLLKNRAMTGGFLLLVKDGAPGFSLDSLRARRAAVRS
jgi:putative oxidoreductase